MSSTPQGGGFGAGMHPGEPFSRGIPDLSEDFERALPARLSNAEDLQRFLSASPAWVHVEYERVSRTLLRFAEAVVEAMENPRCAHDFLQRLDLRSISRDHNWRRIFAELVDSDPSFDGHKRTLVMRYLQFLSERKRLLAYVEAQHAGLEATRDHVLASPPAECPDARTLGVGDTALLELEPGVEQALWIASMRFGLHCHNDGQLTFSGPEGFSRVLRLGRNVVGRHPECDVVLEPAWRTASRVHALLDWERHRPGSLGPTGELAAVDVEEVTEGPVRGTLRITNLASRGTLVP